MIRSYILPVSDRIQETEHTISLCLAQPKIDRIQYYAGQYLTLKLEIEGETYYRSYSISSSPRLDGFIRLTVKRIEDGKVSNYLHDHVKPGDLVEFLRPKGRFFLETATSNERNLMFFAAGSGITPIMSMIRGVLFHEPKSSITLVYANQEEEDIIFKDELIDLARKFQKRFHPYHLLSQQRKASNQAIPSEQRRLDEAWVTDLLATFNHEIAAAYICGPSGFMRAVRKGLNQGGMRENQIFWEEFVANEEMIVRQSAYDGPSHWVEVRQGKEVHQIKVAPGMTLIQAAINQGVDLPYSCKRGVCATCMADLVSGEMEMIDPDSLLEFEKAQGKVLMCQAYPTTDEVVLTI